MTDILIFVLIALTALSLFLLFSLIRSNRQDETLEPYHRALESGLERIERELRDELGRVRQEAATTARGGREEQAQGLDRLAKTLAGQVGQLGSLQAQQLEAFAQQLQRLTQSNEQRFEQLRQSVETRLAAIQTDNATKLEEMRRTVDEKLHATLEQRLGESFKLVSERLEQVHKGLGEMHTLAAGVGDLKKVLTNVKTRGTWGEVELESLLEQVLTIDQSQKNVATRPNSSANGCVRCCTGAPPPPKQKVSRSTKSSAKSLCAPLPPKRRNRKKLYVIFTA